MRNGKTLFVAVGGVMCGIGVALMFLGTVVPFATFAIPALSSLCVFYLVAEFGRGAGALTYIAIGALAVLLVPDKETALLFAFFFGHYPIFKSIFEVKLPAVWCWVCKLALFNLCVIGMYLLAVRVFSVPEIIADFEGAALPYLLALLAAGNIAFAAFDIALTRLLSAYVNVWRDRMIKR